MTSTIIPVEKIGKKTPLPTKIAHALEEIRDEYTQPHEHPWVIGFSGGKDSTLVAQFVFEALMDLPPSERKREIHIISNDTLVESPVLISHIDKMLERLETSAETLRLPIKVVKTKPAKDQTFWVNLIGRGYPSPSRNFRWCTDRMKILPTSTYIREQAHQTGEVILLLGVRRFESATRAATVNKYSDKERLHPHSSLAGCSIFRPILEFTTDDVWECLLQRRPPWGGNHRELVTLYRNAQGGECPLVTDKSEAPSCGSSSSRFGCWTCTVVVKDRSLEAFVDAGYDNLEPLLDFRDWLQSIRDDKDRRMPIRRSGQVSYMKDGSLIPGPFTLKARQEILSKLLDVQSEVGDELITEDEIDIIKQIWAEDIEKDLNSEHWASTQEDEET